MKFKTYLRTESKFKVVEENKEIVCILHCYPSFSKLRELGVNINHLPDFKGSPYAFTVVGRSKCHPDDTFSEITGKRLAERRAKRKAFMKIIKYYRNAYKYHNKVSKVLETLIANCERAL